MKIKNLILKNLILTLGGALLLGALPTLAAPSITQQPSSMTVSAAGYHPYPWYDTWVDSWSGGGSSWSGSYANVRHEGSSPTVTFSVGATGTGTLGYQWRRNGLAVTGATGSSLQVTASPSAAGQSYDCVVRDSSGSVVSQAATVNVPDYVARFAYDFAGTHYGSADWQLVGNAAWVVEAGIGYAPMRQRLRMTSNGNNQTGSAWFTGQKLDGSKDWNIRWTFQGGYPNGTPADGCGLVLQTDGLGVLANGPATWAIGGMYQPFVAISFDDYKNTPLIGANDPSASSLKFTWWRGSGDQEYHWVDLIGLFASGQAPGITTVKGSAAPPYNVEVTYQAKVHQLEVRIANAAQTSGKGSPNDPVIITYTLDLGTILGGRPATIGFNGITGGKAQNHDILNASASYSSPAFSQIVTVCIPASKDNTVFGGSTNSNGAGEEFWAGRTGTTEGGGSRRALIAFTDLASYIPAGSTPTAARLKLYCSDNKNNNSHFVRLHRLTRDWGEGTSSADVNPIGTNKGQGAPPSDGDAEWFNRFHASPAIPWDAPGGDFVPTESASTDVGTTEQFYTWSSDGLLSDLQLWLGNSTTNFGWMLVGDEANARTVKFFASRQNGNTSQRPALEVDYYVTQPVGACGLPDGSCRPLTEAQCNGLGGQWAGAGQPCPAPTGACCLPSGDCTETTGADCAALGGTYHGDGSTCASVRCPVVLTPFVDALPILPVATPTSGEIGGAATYEIAMRQFTNQVHRDLPPTILWGYNAISPGPVILASNAAPVTVRYLNDLRDASGQYRTNHYLAVDPNLMGGMSMDTAGPRTVVHLHGGHVPAASDGYPEFTLLPGEQVDYFYPNLQRAAMLWFHDHALGITRLNVYMGLAGVYLIRDAAEAALGLPSGEFELPLVIQDRTFNQDGSLAYPDMWMEDFFGDTMLVNGKAWPYHRVKPGKYRLRLLNACNSRSLALAFDRSLPFHQIGSDGGLLSAPIVLDRIDLAPAERADTIVDFSGLPEGTAVTLTNSAPAPFPGEPGVGVLPNVMRFIVTSGPAFTNAIPAALTPITPLSTNEAVANRTLVLQKVPDPLTGGRWAINGLRWEDAITETVKLGTTEIWSFVNASGMAHPMHLHLVSFQVLDRQPVQVVSNTVVELGPRVAPPPGEAGWKDTVQVSPDERVRIIARFEDYLGNFPYHCHILEHEDNDMMRQFRVEPTLQGELTSVQITLGALAQSYDGTPHPVSVATDPAGVGVIVTYNGDTNPPVAAGSYAVEAAVTKPGHSGTASNLLVIARAPQVITLDPLSASQSFKKLHKTEIVIHATASSGLSVTLTLDPGSAAQLTGDTLSGFRPKGAFTLRANQAGDSNYLPAAEVVFTADVTLANQTITFAALPEVPATHAPIALSATASSGLPVSFAVVSGPATLNGGALTLTGSGVVTMQATQAGDATFNAAPAVNRSFTVTPVAQSITFAPLPDVTTTNGPITLSATASSGLPVSFTWVSGPAKVSGNQLLLTGAGVVTVQASQAGDVTFAAATPLTQSFAVRQVGQTITFQPLPVPLVEGDAPVELQASASSGLPVRFVSSDPSVLSVSYNRTLSRYEAVSQGPGLATLTVVQNGNSQYEQAPAVTQTIAVNPLFLSLSGALDSLGDYVLTIEGNANRPYNLLYQEDLGATNWTALLTITNLPAPTLQFSVPATNPAQFYRLQRPVYSLP